MRKILQSTLITILFTFISPEISAQYISSTTVQVGSTAVYPGQPKEMVLRIDVEIGNNPVTLTNMMFNSNGSSNPVNDITKSQLWHYNDSTGLNTSLGTLLGTYTSQWLNNYAFLMSSINYTGMNSYSGMIPAQKNYLWLTFDISPNALVCNFIDAQFEMITADGSVQTPVISSPPGFRVIGPCLTGTNENIVNNNISVFPLPCYDNLTVSIDSKVRENITIELYNVSGKKVATLFNGIPDHNVSEFNLSFTNYPPGVYFLNYNSNKKISVKKIIKI